MNIHQLRIGIGHDTHRLQPGGPLRIGGIDIDFQWHLAGHSDADVLLHSVADAILGAAAMGDIGEVFPDTLAENKDRDSSEMLRLVTDRVIQEGFDIINLDCIVFAQRPKLSQYKPRIAARIAEILQIDHMRVGVKATTGEGVGLVGTGQVIQAQCVALMAKR